MFSAYPYVVRLSFFRNLRLISALKGLTVPVVWPATALSETSVAVNVARLLYPRGGA
jgi:hypothetical protein